MLLFLIEEISYYGRLDKFFVFFFFDLVTIKTLQLQLDTHCMQVDSQKKGFIVQSIQTS